MTGPHFNGPEYDPAFDQERLTQQLVRVRDLMLDGRWRTLSEIARKTGDPEASISAQLRHLRKERFGSYVVERRARGDRKIGLFEYRLEKSSDAAPDPKPRCPCCGRVLRSKKKVTVDAPSAAVAEVDPLS